tara:strand:+ start:13859 stop:14209 length:351 start_codon:yes stop_codon:yes gene_type:complete
LRLADSTLDLVDGVLVTEECRSIITRGRSRGPAPQDGIAQVALVFVEEMFFAIGPRCVLQLWLTDPASVFIAIMLRAPQATCITLGCVTDEAGFVGTVSMRTAGRFVDRALGGTEC